MKSLVFSLLIDPAASFVGSGVSRGRIQGLFGKMLIC